MNVLDGVQSALARRHLKPVAKAGFPYAPRIRAVKLPSSKPRMPTSWCCGTVVQDTIRPLCARRAAGILIFLRSAACYMPEITTLWRCLVQGVYAVADVRI